MSTTLLHITNGDSTTEGLQRAHVPGEISTYADVLHVGPVLPDDDVNAAPARWRFLDDAGIVPFEVARETGRRWQAAFDRHADYDVVILWLEHDLFDQLLLIRHLSWFARAGRNDGIELVQADNYLGPMQPQQLIQHLDKRAPVSDEQFATAQRMWQSFTSTDHTGLLAMRDTASLPYLADAIARLLEEYPNHQQGLGRTDRQILELLAEREYGFHELFRGYTETEQPFFMGDTVFQWHLRELTEASHPLITLDNQIALTDIGRSVLAGARTAIELNGIDRWIGGVHLHEPHR